jgi:hypothetical protein
MDYFETHGGYDKDIKYSKENKFLELGGGTLCPPKIVVTHKNSAFGFCWYM